MGAAAARSGAPCVPTATPGPWDMPPAIGDAWFIHYPIYTGCVAARLETRSAAQRAEPQTTKQIRRRPWRHPLWRQPRKGHSLAGEDYGQHRQQLSWRSVSPPAVASRPQRHGRDGPGAARLDEIDEEDEDEDEDEERTTRTWTRTQARRRTRRPGREARTMTR